MDRLARLTTDVIISGSHNDLPHLKPYTDDAKHEASIKRGQLAFKTVEQPVDDGSLAFIERLVRMSLPKMEAGNPPT